MATSFFVYGLNSKFLQEVILIGIAEGDPVILYFNREFCSVNFLNMIQIDNETSVGLGKFGWR